MTGKGFTTGEAARLCRLAPDTVLKWIKKGRLPAARTAGGHFRIQEDELAALDLAIWPDLLTRIGWATLRTDCPTGAVDPQVNPAAPCIVEVADSKTAGVFRQ